MAKKRKYEDEKTWRARIVAWQRSGKSINEFTEQEDLCRSTFLKWRKKLGGSALLGSTGVGAALTAERQRPEQEQANVERLPTVSFVELPPSTRPADEIEYGVPFEVGLRSGRRLQVPTSFDPEALTRLVAILEGR